jgi:hypothetical protein
MPEEHAVVEMRFASVRPLIRYVDPSQAVIEVHFSVEVGGETLQLPSRKTRCMVVTELLGEDGFVDEQHRHVTLADGEGMVKIEMVEPQLWWPAGLGEQPLYQLCVSLIAGDDVLDRHETTIGLTSVRCPAPLLGRQILVNGQEVEISHIVPVDQADERHLLPAAGDSLLLVRGHYGPDVLYHAADRAGILMLQCVPIHPLAKPHNDVGLHVNRLASHPSLVGWFVGHLGALADDVASTLRRLDPTHGIYRSVA